MNNGYLKIEKDALFAGKLEGIDKTWRSRMHTGSNKLQLDFHPYDPAKPSTVAGVHLVARRVDAHFEDCLATKNCLDVLGDGSAAGVAIRNINKNQLDCLERKLMPNFLREKCNQWVRCLKSGGDLTKLPDLGGKSKTGGSVGKRMTATPKGQKRVEFLKAFLRASGARKSTKGKGTKKKSESLAGDIGLGQAAKKECISPDIEDPEAFECECMETLLEICGGINEACFQEKMCTCPGFGICQNWKNENCGKFSTMMASPQRCLATQSHDKERQNALVRLVASDTQTALMARGTTRINASKLDSSTPLEESLTGKCSQ